MHEHPFHVLFPFIIHLPIITINTIVLMMKLKVVVQIRTNKSHRPTF